MGKAALAGLWLAVSVLGTVATSTSQGHAQTGASDSGVVVVVWPQIGGQSLVIQDSEGDLVDRIDPRGSVTARQYQLDPGSYEVHLPGMLEPVFATVRPGEFYTIGIGQPLDEKTIQALKTGEIPLSEAGEISPTDNSLFLPGFPIWLH